MSSSLAFLTSELQALSKEAGRRHGDVKEAADKALALLKSSPESALADLQGQGNNGKEDNVLLAPIILGCASKNTKVISIAVSGLQRLTGIRGAITRATVPSILSTLRSVLAQGVEIQLKILQTLVSLLTNCKDIHGDTMAETLLISFRLQESKIGVVSSTAAATLRQLVMFIFENVDEEDRRAEEASKDSSLRAPEPTSFTVKIPYHAGPFEASSPDDQSPQHIALLPSARDAYLVFEDIANLINGDSPSFLKLQSLPKTFGLELIESVLSDFSHVFRRHPELVYLLRSLLSPLLIKSLAEKPTFSTTLRLMRVMYLLLKKFSDELLIESEIFLNIFIKIICPSEASEAHTSLHTPNKDGSKATSSSSTAALPPTQSTSNPAWMRVLALEILRGLCSDFDLMMRFYTRYDGVAPGAGVSSEHGTQGAEKTMPQGRGSVVKSIINSLHRLATEKPQLLGAGTAVVSGVSLSDHQQQISTGGSAAAGSPAGEYSVSGVVDNLVGMAQQAASTVGVASALSQGSLSLATSSVKLQCIDQLDKADAPPIPETYIYLLAFQCLNAIADGFSSSTVPAYSALSQNEAFLGAGRHTRHAPPPLNLTSFETSCLSDEAVYDRLKTTEAMAEQCWPALLASLSFFLTVNLVDDDLFQATLNSFTNFCTTCGILNLTTPRDAFLTNLSKLSVPKAVIANLIAHDTGGSGGAPSSGPSASRYSQPSSIITVGADALGLTSHQPQYLFLSTRNLLCLRALINVARTLAGSLGRTWFYIFEALHNADYCLRSETNRRHKKRSTGPSSALPVSPSKGGSGATSAAGAPSNASAMARYLPTEQEEQSAQQRIHQLFETATLMGDESFTSFLEGLCRLDREMIGLPSQDDAADPSMVRRDSLTSPSKHSESGMEDVVTRQTKRSGINVIRMLRPGEKSYAISKLGDISLMAMPRLVNGSEEGGWQIVTGHLLLVQQWQAAASNVRLQAAEVLDKIVSNAPKSVEGKDEALQKRVQEQLLHALAIQAKPIPAHLRATGVSTSTTDIDIRKAGLDTLLRLLESQGHSLVCGWSGIFSILASACPTGKSVQDSDAETFSAADSAKTATLIRVAFPSLQLICSDFLAALTVAELEECVNTLADFGDQIDDVNVALTAGGLLWQVSDHLQAQRRRSVDASDAFLNLWLQLLQRLLGLSLDKRQEARDGAIQILWRSVELYGATLDTESWEKLLWEIIFPLLTRVDEGVRLAPTLASKAPVSADTSGYIDPDLMTKQWDDSKILVLKSAGSVFAHELPESFAALPSFEKVCETLVGYTADAFLHNNPKVATAAMQCMHRICEVRWQDSQAEKVKHVAELAWQAWTRIGEEIKADRKQDSTQQNLEAYVKLVTVLQRSTYARFDSERYRQMLAILKSVLLYPYSPEYRPDQDVMPPLQAAVMEAVAEIQLVEDDVISAVLEDLSEYMTLAYTPSVRQSSQVGGDESKKRKNQAVTYVALSKASTTQIVEIYHRFKDRPALYGSAVESVFAAYAVPLRLKYDCPAASKFGDDQPLWKTASLHFMQLVRTCVEAMVSLETQLSGDMISKTWMRMIACFRSILTADCRPTLTMSLDERRGEEDFDLMILTTIEMHILPVVGTSKVPAEAIKQLAEAISQASQLRLPHQEESHSDLLSPSISIGDSLTSTHKDSSYLDVREAALVEDGTTVDDADMPRERFAYWCLDLLFLMCAKSSNAEEVAARRIAVYTMPLLFGRCLTALSGYVADAAIRGRLPFSRVREEELVYLLGKLADLELEMGTFALAMGPDPDGGLQQWGSKALPQGENLGDLLLKASRCSSRAHLFELYPQLVQLCSLPRFDAGLPQAPSYASLWPSADNNSLGTASGLKGHADGAPGAQPQTALSARDLSRKCLEIVGTEFGSSSKKTLL